MTGKKFRRRRAYPRAPGPEGMSAVEIVRVMKRRLRVDTAAGLCWIFPEEGCKCAYTISILMPTASRISATSNVEMGRGTARQASCPKRCRHRHHLSRDPGRARHRLAPAPRGNTSSISTPGQNHRQRRREPGHRHRRDNPRRGHDRQGPLVRSISRGRSGIRFSSRRLAGGGARPGARGARLRVIGRPSIRTSGAAQDAVSGRAANCPSPIIEVMDPFVVLSAAAGVTKTLKLATGVCLVVQRDRSRRQSLARRKLRHPTGASRARAERGLDRSGVGRTVSIRRRRRLEPRGDRGPRHRFPRPASS